MSASHIIKLRPSGKQFLAGSSQSLLHAGLVAGVNLRYGCENGSCGDCKAQLLSGTTEAFQHSDYRLSAQEKSQNTLLLCCHRAASDLELQVQESDQPLSIPQQQINLKVRSIRPLSPDVLQVEFKTPRTQALQFLAGQYVELELSNGLRRNKSLANCPCDGNSPTIHVSRVEGDEFSQYVFEKLRKNDSVALLGPKGNFVVREDDQSRPVMLVAYKTGFSSINSLIEHLLAQDFSHQIRLYWIINGNQDIYRQNYCQSLQDALDNFEYRPICIAQENPELLVETLQQILSAHSKKQDCEVFAAIPRALHEKTRELFSTAGFASQRIHLDYLEKL